MHPPAIPKEDAASVKRIVALLDVGTQYVLRHRWELEGAIFLTREQLGKRFKLTVGDVRRLELAGRNDVKALLPKATWL